MGNRMRTNLSKVAGDRPRSLVAFGLAVALGAAACGTSPPGDQTLDNRGSKIIGGFAANDPVLDAIGSLVVHFGSNGLFFGPPIELCGATLIGPETVLTAKHCGLIVPEIISIGATLTFAVGPNSLYPKREINIVEVDLAPGDIGGFVGVGHDAAVMHLETPVTDIQPVDLTVLSDDQIGDAFAAIGYGIQDNSGANGTRRLGKQTLRSRQGKIFETLFGSFDNFFQWFLNGTAPGGSATTEALGPDPDGGPPVESDAGPPVDTDASPPPGVDGGGPFPPPPSLEDFARLIYDSTVLDQGYEVVTGGAPGDAQPCFGDSGSSLILHQNDHFVSFGVVSGGLGTRDLICDLGTVYATFGPGVLEFLQTARTWTDPCGDLDSHGACDGDVARRCTNLAEGRRRIVDFDCSLLGMTCNMNGGQVSCDGNVFGPPPPPVPGPGPKADPRAQADKVFMTPAALAARRH